MIIDEYLEEQPVAVKTLKQAIKNNKISHAYLFETNQYKNSKKLIMAFIKDIICNDVEDHTKKDNIISQIDNEEYIELKIIDPSTIQIKKEEMINLQEEFKNKAIEGTKKIYVINNAEKLNSFSGNTILKFLEEPEENIIAILITNNRYQILDTILSRCQLISLINSKNEEINSTFEKLDRLVYNNTKNVVEEKKKEQIANTINFIKYYEIKKKDTLLFSNKEFLQYFPNRDDVIFAFDIMKLFYLDALKFKTNTKVENFDDFKDDISKIAYDNTVLSLIIKINKIIKNIEKIKYNVNINLLIDSFIIELGDERND